MSKTKHKPVLYIQTTFASAPINLPSSDIRSKEEYLEIEKYSITPTTFKARLLFDDVSGSISSMGSSSSSSSFSTSVSSIIAALVVWA